MYRIKYSLFWSPQERGEIVIQARNERQAYLEAFNTLVKRLGTSIVIGSVRELRGAK